MTSGALTDFVETMATELAIPGVAAGVVSNGDELYACHGATSTENPLPVDKDTMFLMGSISKTYTATAVMRLVARGQVDLAAPVRRYVPELHLKDERVAVEMTVLNLLNHTSGMSMGLIVDTGEGDDALERYVSSLTALDLIAMPGQRTSYSSAGYNLAGRIVEKVTDMTFEQAVASLVFEPVGLKHSFYARDDVMTRRFSVGHNVGEDGQLSIARLWRRSRGDNPSGGIASSVSDQLRWARFQLGDVGVGALPLDMLEQMRQPTAELRGSNMGHAVGVGWFLRDIDGVRAIGHGGSANGQFAELLVVPERGFAVVSVSNAGPRGIPFNQAVIRWALESYLGLIDRDPEPMPYDEARAGDLLGAYENDVMNLTIDTTTRGLRLEVLMKPAIRAAAERDLPPDHAPFDFGMLPGDRDEYVITSGAFKGQRGFFTRDTSGAVVGIDLAGRLFSRATAEGMPSSSSTSPEDAAANG